MGDLLGDAGVIGRFALDFVVTRADETAAWETYAIEINLRSALGSTGRFGLTAVGNSPEEADEIFEHAKTVLDEEARFDELE